MGGERCERTPKRKALCALACASGLLLAMSNPRAHAALLTTDLATTRASTATHKDSPWRNDGSRILGLRVVATSHRSSSLRLRPGCFVRLVRDRQPVRMEDVFARGVADPEENANIQFGEVLRHLPVDSPRRRRGHPVWSVLQRDLDSVLLRFDGQRVAIVLALHGSRWRTRGDQKVIETRRRKSLVEIGAIENELVGLLGRDNGEDLGVLDEEDVAIKRFAAGVEIPGKFKVRQLPDVQQRPRFAPKVNVRECLLTLARPGATAVSMQRDVKIAVDRGNQPRFI